MGNEGGRVYGLPQSALEIDKSMARIVARIAKLTYDTTKETHRVGSSGTTR
ncbi:uncharacterized protein ATNIH1004_005601 [Aspergillus tanneri]|uniref:Uncharacterized protein n=1 Tax=Aspergillus tanneri TaxID=1220188 RepID=A0A5M9MLZ8_9EURO|nr:uncharacterized protein ATNIH1004_005601 [Aspergillus tanneri]KAA8646926.1 hypothetical protein ATNIH1004_005601 [Aspergillus tanneri]